jgi:hypothetical protein
MPRLELRSAAQRTTVDTTIPRRFVSMAITDTRRTLARRMATTGLRGSLAASLSALDRGSVADMAIAEATATDSVAATADIEADTADTVVDMAVDTVVELSAVDSAEARLAEDSVADQAVADSMVAAVVVSMVDQPAAAFMAAVVAPTAVAAVTGNIARTEVKTNGCQSIWQPFVLSCGSG